MDRIGLDVILAAVVATWFVVTGIVELLARPPATGRRAATASPGPPTVVRRIRSALAVLGGAAVAVGAAIGVLRASYPFPGRALGLGLAALALWAAAEAARPPARWLRVALAAIGFILAVFYAGFRA